MLMDNLIVKIDNFILKQQEALIPRRIRELVHRGGKTFVRERTAMVKPSQIKINPRKTLKHFENIFDEVEYIDEYGNRKVPDVPIYDTQSRLEKVRNSIKDFKGYYWDEIKNKIDEMIKASKEDDEEKLGDLAGELADTMDREALKIAELVGAKYPSEGWRSSKSRWGWINPGD